MKHHLLLGTAGHIDHGKTALVKVLTGTDTDRLPEEKRRGITVELGFAALNYDDLSIGIVDVPGHEDLIKNMLAGATGIDMALLVVAADEGVMPQTREHFQVLRLLGISKGVIALTKSDLVEESWLDLVEEEVEALVAGSFLESAECVRVSAKTGEGIEQLRMALYEAARHGMVQNTDGPFRMAIDRCFSSEGHGTVVTGSVSSGSVLVGNELEIMPQGISVKVRALQSHSQSVDSIERGQRAALNLSGVHFRTVHRGQPIATPGSLHKSKRITVVLESSENELFRTKSTMSVRCYAGTAEHIGKMRCLSSNEVDGRTIYYAQIELKEDLCAVWKHPFIVRNLYANQLLGGGWIADPLAYRIKKSDPERIKLIHELAYGSEENRIIAAVKISGHHAWNEEMQTLRTGVIHGEAVIERLVAAGTLESFRSQNKCRLIHGEMAGEIANRLLAKLLEEHHDDPLRKYIPLDRLRPSFANLKPASLLDAIVKKLVDQKKVVLGTDGLCHPSWSGKLTARQTQVSKAMISSCLEAGLKPPSVGDFAKQFDLKDEQIASLLQLAVDSQHLVRLPDKDLRDRQSARNARLYLHVSEVEKLTQQVLNRWNPGVPWTVSEFNEAFDLSRKYAVPLCRYLDELGITERIGDHRQVVSPST